MELWHPRSVFFVRMQVICLQVTKHINMEVLQQTSALKVGGPSLGEEEWDGGLTSLKTWWPLEF